MWCKNGVRIVFIVLWFSFLCDFIFVHVHHNLFYVSLFPVDVLNVFVNNKNIMYILSVFLGSIFRFGFRHSIYVQWLL